MKSFENGDPGIDHRLHEAWTLTHEALFPGPDPPAWEVDVAWYLFLRRYHVDTIRCVLEYARATGSVECHPLLAFDARDRARVEDLLPAAAEAAWEAHDGTWAPTLMGVVP